MDLASSVNLILGTLSVVAQVVASWLIFSWLFGFAPPTWLRSRAVAVAFAAALVATLGSLTYSEILGYEPCKLCWVQRILMYPQALMLGMALWSRHRGSRALLDLSFIMSAAGALVSAYHYLLQLGVIPEGSCAAVGYSVSCAQRFVMQFGYITIPLMAFSAFLLIALVLRQARIENHRSQGG